jgi:hypothetical protein
VNRKVSGLKSSVSSGEEPKGPGWLYKRTQFAGFGAVQMGDAMDAGPSAPNKAKKQSPGGWNYELDPCLRRGDKEGSDLLYKQSQLTPGGLNRANKAIWRSPGRTARVDCAKQTQFRRIARLDPGPAVQTKPISAESQVGSGKCHATARVDPCLRRGDKGRGACCTNKANFAVTVCHTRD